MLVNLFFSDSDAASAFVLFSDWDDSVKSSSDTHVVVALDTDADSLEFEQYKSEWKNNWCVIGCDIIDSLLWEDDDLDNDAIMPEELDIYYAMEEDEEFFA